jgi:hypothetical protein
MDNLDEHDLDLLLRSADPRPASTASLRVHDGPTELLAGVPRRRSRRVPIVAGALGLLGGLAVAVPAAADYFAAHTGRQEQPCPGLPAGSPSCLNGTGEIIRLDAPDIGKVYAEYVSRYPLPAGQTWDRFLARVGTPTTEPAMDAASGIENMVALSAQCQWGHAWLQARTHGDATALAAARRQLVHEIPGWIALTSHEVQTPTREEQTAQAVRADQPAYLEQDVAVNCVPSDWGSSESSAVVGR